ncbi:hypothetical protein HanPI659440_Chr16g0619371 [Helianthus annuus]|nr:hypothetical protein HanIR_Chr16g0787831 [Helianthus annuus]KAJ0679994.1 hypothetical protein HanPI659440_Chr16g0619351 [Helianthus annuus]KAJ0679996.1 hypothetical protein HanPI659440_Chr16g0619371 [Helianthus annuus]
MYFFLLPHSKSHCKGFTPTNHSLCMLLEFLSETSPTLSKHSDDFDDLRLPLPVTGRPDAARIVRHDFHFRLPVRVS